MALRRLADALASSQVSGRHVREPESS